MNNTSKLLLVALGGVALGATAGILFAPKSGKETREDLANNISKLKEKIADLLAQGSDAASETVDELKDKLSNMEKQMTENKKA